MIYPDPINDNTLNKQSTSACNSKQGCKNAPPPNAENFNPRNFYPHSYIKPNSSPPSNTQGYNNQHDYNHNNDAYHGQNDHWQHNAQQQGQPNNQWQQSYAQAQYDAPPQQANNYNPYQQAPYPYQPNMQAHPPYQNQPPKQKNMFGSLDPQQLMSMLTSKGSFGNLAGMLGNNNPQLSMLMGLMQNNKQKPSRASKQKQVDEIVIDDQKESPSSYRKVKDFYKEHDE